MFDPVILDTGAAAINTLYSVDSRGNAELKISWRMSEARLNADFAGAFDEPAMALEVLLGRIEKLGRTGPLDYSALVGVLARNCTDMAKR